MLALLAVQKLGEATAHEVARELGVETIRHTLGRLEQRGLVVRKMMPSNRGQWYVWVYQVAKEAHVGRSPALT